MRKVGIVILNYLNYWDTIECIDSIYKMQYDISGIVIVDNHSSNESINILYGCYRNTEKIILIRTGKNYGYAKGNNIGIEIARKRFHSDFVFVVNNDVVFWQRDFFEKLLIEYEKGVGLIGPQIFLKGGVQKRFSDFLSFKHNLNIYMRNYLTYKKKDIWMKILPIPNAAERTEVLHGCGLLFTPDFFEYYPGFYEKTFLYNEEGILYLMCEQHNLRQVYAEHAYLYHKEDQSSEQSFKNDERVKLYFCLKSQKYLLWWIFKNKLKKFRGRKK